MINYFCCLRCAVGLKFEDAEMPNERAENLRAILHGRGKAIDTLPLVAVGTECYSDSCSVCDEKLSTRFVQWQMRDDVWFVAKFGRSDFEVWCRQWDTTKSIVLAVELEDAAKLWEIGVELRDGVVLVTREMIFDACGRG